ncbi:acyltransferase [Escherichia coli]|nr:acyltransferase [Escherichia coli]EFH6600196.1 acyltransferase family protein [Escherichia coli]EJA4568230.1 acyltransferase [Escherichia coli]ELA3966449.1 acyltransferase [Escherichia coli]
MKHVTSLDGARGIAVIMVMLFHSNIPWASLGWAGVPLFFCLSGFLITSILEEDRKYRFAGYIKKFLINRSLRIFPLFYLYLAVNFVIVKSMGGSTEGYSWFVTYLQNYYIGNNITTPGILGHTWSLAIEEQFYWIWPIVIFFIRPPKEVCFFVFLVIISLASRYFIFNISGGNPYITNVTLISCVDMLVLGAIFAHIKDSNKAPQIAMLTFIVGSIVTAYGVINIGINNFWHPEQWVGKGLYLFTSLGMTFSSIIWFLYYSSGKMTGQQQTATDSNRQQQTATASNILQLFITTCNKIFNLKFLRFTGNISYGLYMWHLLCFSIVRKMFSFVGITTDGFTYIAASFIVSYAVSIASFYLFESFFLRFKVKSCREGLILRNSVK